MWTVFAPISLSCQFRENSNIGDILLGCQSVMHDFTDLLQVDFKNEISIEIKYREFILFLVYLLLHLHFS